jgi:hypothetical protein
MALREFDQKLHNKSNYPRMCVCVFVIIVTPVSKLQNFVINTFLVQQMVYFLQVCPTNYYILIDALFLNLQHSKQTQFRHRAF